MIAVFLLQQLVFSADKVHLGNGTVLEHAVVTVADGRIVAVAGGAGSGDAQHVDGAEITPGLVDAYSYMGVDADSLEQSREDTASHRLSQTVRLDAPAFRRALEEGVTTAYLSPDSMNVFGGLGMTVKTAGGASADLFAPEQTAARVLNAEGALKITLGNDPSQGNYPPRGSPPGDLYGRRPTTRMGTVWTVRKEFYEAQDYRARQGHGNADYDTLLAVLDGKIPVRVQARRSNDVQTALRLAAELGWKQMVLEEGTEAYRCAGLLAAAKVPVICGPLYDELSKSVVLGITPDQWHSFTSPPPICCEREEGLPEQYRTLDQRGIVELSGLALDLASLALPRYEAAGLYSGRPDEGDFATPALPALLRRAGVTVALGAAEAHDVLLSEASVIQQARLAVCYGADPEDALRMATQTGAALCGLDRKLGTLEPGKDADFVLWSGPPLHPDSRPLVVVVDGRVVLDRRPQS